MWSASNLKIFHKGMILIAVPLAFEIAFVTVLVVLRHQAESEAAQAERSKKIVAISQGIPQAATSAAQILFMSAFVDSGDWHADYKRARAEIDRQFQELRELVKDNPRQMENYRQVQALEADNLENLDEVADGLSDSRTRAMFTLANYKIEMVKLLIKGNIGLDKIAQEEKKQSHAEGASRSRARLETWLYGGIILNIALAVAMVYFFSREVSGRISVLVDNTDRLVRQETLMPRLSGTDEIAHLDEVFHKMATALVEAARKERAIVDQAFDVICSVDGAGKFVRVNPASSGGWGFEPEELVGRSLAELVPEEDKQKFARNVELLKREAAANAFEGRLTRKDGTTIDVEWSAHWSDADETLFCVVHDITQRKELDRLKREFVAMITHDLRSPLTGILFTMGLFNEGAYGELCGEMKEQISTVEGAVEQMLGLINDLLYVEKLEAGKMAMSFDIVSLSRLLDLSVKPLRAIAEHQKVSLIVPPVDTELYGDEDKLARVLLNLVSNAIKFSPQGGEVRVSVAETNGFVEVRVCDQGPGIARENAQTIFERFKQVGEKSRKSLAGTGLGLAICKDIIEGHRGTIGVDSELGHGSTFWFRLPRST